MPRFYLCQSVDVQYSRALKERPTQPPEEGVGVKPPELPEPLKNGKKGSLFFSSKENNGRKKSKYEPVIEVLVVCVSYLALAVY